MTPETLASIFPGDVAVAIATSEMYAQMPLDLEAGFIKTAGEKRRREFVAGRAAARCAISKLRHFGEAIPINPDRTPQWPDGFLGSISHCDRFCAAAVGTTDKFLGIGFDAETNVAIEQPVLKLIFAPQEVAHLAALPQDRGIAWEKTGFSAKEAFYKCHYPRTKQFLNFHDVGIRFEPAQQQAEGGFVITVREHKAGLQADASYAGKFVVQGGIICTSIVLPRDGAPADKALDQTD
jgi:4'-phosphopantetheinyl transferase EntD